MSEENNAERKNPTRTDNPFENNPFYDQKSLANTLCYTSECLELIKSCIHQPHTEPSVLEPGARESLIKVLETLHSALSAALGDQLDAEFSSKTTEKIEDFTKLSQAQQVLIKDLVGDIADGNMDKQHLVMKTPPRIALARYEAITAEMSAEECAAEFDRIEIDVDARLTTVETGGYIVSKTWTLKGLRHALAREMFMDSIQFVSAEQGGWDASS